MTTTATPTVTRTLPLRAGNICMGLDGMVDWKLNEPRAVIFRNDSSPRPWTVYLPYEWPMVHGGSTHVCHSYREAVSIVRASQALMVGRNAQDVA
jgi:hypothetical protein